MEPQRAAYTNEYVTAALIGGYLPMIDGIKLYS